MIGLMIGLAVFGAFTAGVALGIWVSEIDGHDYLTDRED